MIHPYVYAVFHEPVGVIESAVGGKRDVTLGGEHEFYFHASTDGFAQCFLDRMVEREVRVDDFDAVLCHVDGIGIECADNLVAGVWFAVDDAYSLLVGCSCGVRF